MTFTLTRTNRVATGIFGTLQSTQVIFACKTLEHAYPDADKPSLHLPKLPEGTYTCVRGTHTVGHENPITFETFEVTNVPGHTGILFHSGNFNADSEGCILLGEEQDGLLGISNSRVAFQEFMTFLTGLDSFELVVE